VVWLPPPWQAMPILGFIICALQLNGAVNGIGEATQMPT